MCCASTSLLFGINFPILEWLFHFALCVFNISQQANFASLCALFVKGDFHQAVEIQLECMF